MEKPCSNPLLIALFLCLFLLGTSFNITLIFPFHTLKIFSIFQSCITTNNKATSYFVEDKIKQKQTPPHTNINPSVPRFAYLVSGSKGDLEKLWRCLRTIYHPWNYYVVHLDLESHVQERLELASRLEKDEIFAQVGNVEMVTKANMVTYRGPTMVANTLHACAILLEKYKDWDWFINLSASDYPLVTQDDLLYTFSDVKRDLNFIEHTSQLGWKETERAMPLIIDPGLYKTTKSDIFWVTPRRNVPTDFKLFTGSAWMILSREFVDYCIWGWDNLPRNLLLYYSNFVSSPEGYFQTVICNAQDFSSTVVNHDMHYISWDVPPKQHPHTLSVNHTENMIASGAAFARKFKENDPVLDKIDVELLRRGSGGFTPGGWCSGNPPCSEVGNPRKLKPGPGAHRLMRLIGKLVLSAKLNQQQCS